MAKPTFMSFRWLAVSVSRVKDKSPVTRTVPATSKDAVPPICNEGSVDPIDIPAAAREP